MNADAIRALFGKKNDPSGEDLARLDAILASARFDIAKRPPSFEYIFSHVDDFGRKSPIGFAGCLGLVKGPEKSRKTTLLKAFAASAISGKRFINFHFDLGKEGKAAFFDTEQQGFDFWNTQSQIHYLGGMTTNFERYNAFTFLEASVEERFQLIERYVETTDNVRMIVIDGALDLIEDFNDIRESRQASERLTRIANRSGAVVFVVIHSSGKTGFKGKGGGNSLGHFGSFLQRKCKFAIALDYDEKTHFTNIVHALARGTGKFPGFNFTNDKNGYPILDHNQTVELPQIVTTPQPVFEELPF